MLNSLSIPSKEKGIIQTESLVKIYPNDPRFCLIRFQKYVSIYGKVYLFDTLVYEII